MKEITKTTGQRPKTQMMIWVFFAFTIVIVYLTGLNIPLLGPDEPRYAEVAREMFERGDWVTPTLGGFDWFEKPALLYWLEIISYKIFGVTEFAARFGSAICGLSTILSLWVLGKNCSPIDTEKREVELLKPKAEDQNPKNDFANWLALIAASSIGLIVFSRGASFDIILTFPVTAALVSFFIFDLRQERKTGKTRVFPFSTSTFCLVSFYFFIGVALIAKGLIGIIFPLAIVVFYYILSRKFPSNTFIYSLVWGTILSILVASVWYLPMYRANGWKFVDEFFIQHHFQRYTSNKYQHPQPFYFFFWVLPLMSLPWLPFFLASLWNFFKSQISNFKSQIKEKAGQSLKSQVQNKETSLPFSSSPLLLFSLSWLTVPLVFFSLSGSKLPGYILPALPAALILTARYIRQFVQKSARRRIIVQIIAFLMLAGVALVSQFLIGDFLHTETVKHLVETADSQGYKTEKIFNLHTVSHNLEFYGAGRIVRDFEGKQRRFEGVTEVTGEMKDQNLDEILVLIPLEYVKQLTESQLVEARILGDNGELAMVFVKNKPPK